MILHVIDHRAIQVEYERSRSHPAKIGRYVLN
jgi:hypothetical protein